MAFTSITKPTLGSSTKKSFADAVVDNLNDLNSRIIPGDSVVPNGSFEIDADADNIPDGWTQTLYTGGSSAFTGSGLGDTDCIHGKRAFKFTSPGGASNGGGYLTTTNLIEITPNREYQLFYMMRVTASTLAFKIEADIYQSNGSTLIGTYTLASMAANLPTVWTPMSAILNLQSSTYALARYTKLRVIGCHTSSTTAGSTYIDGISLKLLEFQRRIEFEGAGTAATALTWVCPTGVTIARVTAFGGGGGGGGLGTGQSFGGGGGGGGSFAQSVLQVTAGTSYAISVGGGGVGAASTAGTNGGDTTFASTTVVGKGGTGGATGATGTGGAGGTGGTGQITLDGITGDNGVSASIGGNGGGSLQGKSGGQGGTATVGSPPNASSRGAGGGGAFRVNTTAGGNGGYGSLIIEY